MSGSGPGTGRRPDCSQVSTGSRGIVGPGARTAAARSSRTSSTSSCLYTERTGELREIG